MSDDGLPDTIAAPVSPPEAVMVLAEQFVAAAMATVPYVQASEDRYRQAQWSVAVQMLLFVGMGHIKDKKIRSDHLFTGTGSALAAALSEFPPHLRDMCKHWLDTGFVNGLALIEARKAATADAPPRSEMS